MTDILQDSNGDIQLVNGDIAYGESTLQHQRDILLTLPGELKHAPDRGVGIVKHQDDEGVEDLLRSTRKEFIKDGMTVRSIKLENNNIATNAAYE